MARRPLAGVVQYCSPLAPVGRTSVGWVSEGHSDGTELRAAGSAVEREVEQWFIDRGVPHLIRDYSASEDIFTRAFPFLAFVMFVQLFLAFTRDYDGWGQAGLFLAGVGLFVGAFALVNKARGRTLFLSLIHI